MRTRIPSIQWRTAFKVAAAITTTVIFGMSVWLLAVGKSYLQVEAKTMVAEVEFAPGQPVAWSLEGGQLLECTALMNSVEGGGAVGGGSGLATVSPGITLNELQSIEFVARRDPSSNKLDTATAAVQVVNGMLLIELAAPEDEPKSTTSSSGSRCAPPSSAVVLDRGDGTRQALQLPALIKLPASALGDGLTLEFRGQLRVGREVRHSKQPLLISGKLVMREVRPAPLQSLGASAFFEVDSRDLVLGDQLTLMTKLRDDPSPSLDIEAPQGFLRIVRDDKGVELSVTATAKAAYTELVHPFSKPETPQVNHFKVATRDDLIQVLMGLLGAILTLGISLYPLLPEPTAANGSRRK